MGIHPSRDMIDFAQTHFALPNLRFQVADARRLSFPKPVRSRGFFFNALHWIPEQEAALRSIRTALNEGGRAQLRLVPEARARAWRPSSKRRDEPRDGKRTFRISTIPTCG